MDNRGFGVNNKLIKTVEKICRTGPIVPILILSRTTYIDSLTGITESESGGSSDELKITGRPELFKMKKLDRDLENESNLKGYYKS